MRSRDVLISGAGIAGPALAYWLREYGFSATVVERAAAPRPGGQAVDMRGAGRTVVERMGLLDRVRAVSLDQRGIAFVDANGRIAARMPTELFGGEGIVSEVEVLRGDLGQVLYEATAPDTHYLFDDTLRGLEQDIDAVTATFEKAPARRFDLVVGADGLHSAVRGLAFGPRRSVSARSAVTRRGSPRLPDSITTAGSSCTTLQAAWWPRSGPDGCRVRSRRGSASARHPSTTTAARPRRAQMDILAARFSGLGWEVPRLLKAMRTAPDFFFDSMGQVHLDRWSSHRTR